MMKKWLLGAGVSALLASVSVSAAAQDGRVINLDEAEGIPVTEAHQAGAEPEPGDATDIFGLGFEIEPLTAEQEARMPLARRVLEQALPEGAFSEIMSGTYAGIFGAIAEEVEPDPSDSLVETLGYAYTNYELDDGKAERALAILDPAWRERAELEMSFFQDYMAEIYVPLEPVMREAMAELYAINFTEQQLMDIEAFYLTETGQVYVRQALTMSSDPRLYAAMMQTPDLFGAMMEPDTSAMEAALEALPERPGFDDLSAGDRAQVSALLGIEESELEEYMRYSDYGYLDEAEEAEAILEEVSE